MKDIQRVIEWIDVVIAGCMDRPHMYAVSAEALEEKLITLEDVRELCIELLSGPPRNLPGYCEFLEERGFGVSRFTIKIDWRLSAGELETMQRLCDFWKDFMSSKHRHDITAM